MSALAAAPACRRAGAGSSPWSRRRWRRRAGVRSCVGTGAGARRCRRWCLCGTNQHWRWVGSVGTGAGARVCRRRRRHRRSRRSRAPSNSAGVATSASGQAPVPASPVCAGVGVGAGAMCVGTGAGFRRVGAGVCAGASRVKAKTLSVSRTFCISALFCLSPKVIALDWNGPVFIDFLCEQLRKSRI